MMAEEVEGVRPEGSGLVPVSQGGEVVTSCLEVRKTLSPPSMPKELRTERLVRVRVVLVARAVWSMAGCVFWTCVRREEGKNSSYSSSQTRGAGGMLGWRIGEDGGRRTIVDCVGWDGPLLRRGLVPIYHLGEAWLEYEY